MDIFQPAMLVDPGDAIPEVESFDPSNGSWSETVAMNTPRVGGAAAVTGGAWKTWWGWMLDILITCPDAPCME